MRNAEWTCRHWLDRPHSRFDLGTAIPHSALHIPHFPLCQSDALDATYRADLRELNELNFSRFDAKLEQRLATLDAKLEQRDRKSTRLNSSHGYISYAVFCLKKKKINRSQLPTQNIQVTCSVLTCL